MGLDAMILLFWMLSFKPTFSLSSFIFIKRLCSSSSLFALRVVSSAYLRLLIFLQAILIPTCASSSPVFLMMYSAYKLNKQGDNIQPWRTPFPIWNQAVVPCPVLTVASWPAYRFLKRQVRSTYIFYNTCSFACILKWCFYRCTKKISPLHMSKCSSKNAFSVLVSLISRNVRLLTHPMIQRWHDCRAKVHLTFQQINNEDLRKISRIPTINKKMFLKC